MDIIHKKRADGKTTDAIRLAHNTGGMIVCMSQDECSRIAAKATELGLQIVFPISFDEFVKHQYHGKGIKNFIIDQADYLLQSMTSVPIIAITANIDRVKH